MRRETWATYDKTIDRSLPTKLLRYGLDRRGKAAVPVLTEHGGSIRLEFREANMRGYEMLSATMSKRAALLLGRALLRRARPRARR